MSYGAERHLNPPRSEFAEARLGYSNIVPVTQAPERLSPHLL